MSFPVPHIHTKKPEPQITTINPRPFHEAIVDIIEQASRADISLLAKIIKSTIILENHVDIVLAWEGRLIKLGLTKTYQVTVYLVNQRELAKAKKIATGE